MSKYTRAIPPYYLKPNQVICFTDQPNNFGVNLCGKAIRNTLNIRAEVVLNEEQELAVKAAGMIDFID